MTDFSNFLIASDLDGTFLCEGQMVSRNLAALERFRAGGGIFTIATGRAHLNVRSAIGEPTSVINAPAICDNGAYLYDFESKQKKELPETEWIMIENALPAIVSEEYQEKVLRCM